MCNYLWRFRDGNDKTSPLEMFWGYMIVNHLFSNQACEILGVCLTYNESSILAVAPVTVFPAIAVGWLRIIPGIVGPAGVVGVAYFVNSKLALLSIGSLQNRKDGDKETCRYSDRNGLLWGRALGVRCSYIGNRGHINCFDARGLIEGEESATTHYWEVGYGRKGKLFVADEHTVVSVIVPVATCEQASEMRDDCQPVMEAGVATTVRFSS